MPKGFFHTSWRRLANESDYIIDNPESAPEMVKAELLVFPLQREFKECVTQKPYLMQLVEYHKDGKTLPLTYDADLDKTMVQEGWERTLKTYEHKYRKPCGFKRTEPVWVPVLMKTRITSEAFIRSPRYVRKMYNTTFPKKIHVTGHLWIEPVRIVSQRVPFDKEEYGKAPMPEWARNMVYNKNGVTS